MRALHPDSSITRLAALQRPPAPDHAATSGVRPVTARTMPRDQSLREPHRAHRGLDAPDVVGDPVPRHAPQPIEDEVGGARVAVSRLSDTLPGLISVR